MARPWMPLYGDDYMADTGHLSREDHGSYLLLIMYYWHHGRLPSDDAQLARIAKASLKEWKASKPIIQAFFFDGWRHKRIDIELSKSDAAYKRRADAGRVGGNSKAANPGNARPMLEAMLKQEGKQTPSNALATHIHSANLSEDSTSTTINDNLQPFISADEENPQIINVDCLPRLQKPKTAADHGKPQKTETEIYSAPSAPLSPLDAPLQSPLGGLAAPPAARNGSGAHMVAQSELGPPQGFLGDLAKAPKMAAPTRQKRIKTRTALSGNAQPTAEDLSHAAAKSVNPRIQWPKFRDHHIGKGNVMADWHAAWRTWCGNAKEFARPPNRQNGGSSKGGFAQLYNEFMGNEYGNEAPESGARIFDDGGLVLEADGQGNVVHPDDLPVVNDVSGMVTKMDYHGGNGFDRASKSMFDNAQDSDF